jgi:hypothetical protein
MYRLDTQIRLFHPLRVLQDVDRDLEVECRGGFLFGCCVPMSMKVKEARGEEHLAGPTAPDANVVDGGDVDPDPINKV